MMKNETMTMSPMCQQMSDFVQTIQNRIVLAFEALDDQAFQTDVWERPGGGGGITKVIEGGRVFEKGGVNTSAVEGKITDKEKPMFEALLKQQSLNFPKLETPRFFATGVSLVMHPRNPMVATVHANYRYFELETEADPIWWFGGGADLTPYYLFEEDAIHFHSTLKHACDDHDLDYYPKFSKRCDEYFYLPHRKETRGVGGLFFDYLNHQEKETLFQFVSGVANAFLPSYVPIVEKRQGMPFDESDRKWQAMRRGRYAEFNLIYDRGTTFGLKTNGRTESILMSLPPQVDWHYQDPEDYESKGNGLLKVLQSPRSWV